MAVKYFKRFNASLDKGLAKAVFDHVRNYMMCALLLAIGVTWSDEGASLLFEVIPTSYSGLSLIILSFILFCLNLYDGVREISKSRYHTALTVGLVVLYIAMSVVVIELASSFRASLQFS